MRAWTGVNWTDFSQNVSGGRTFVNVVINIRLLWKLDYLFYRLEECELLDEDLITWSRLPSIDLPG